MKILLPINQVPCGGIVTKRGGEKKYRVQKEFRIYTQLGNREVLSCGSSRFMIPVEDELIAMTAVDGSTEVLWHASFDDVQDYLDERLGR